MFVLFFLLIGLFLILYIFWKELFVFLLGNTASQDIVSVKHPIGYYEFK